MSHLDKLREEYSEKSIGEGIRAIVKRNLIKQTCEAIEKDIDKINNIITAHNNKEWIGKEEILKLLRGRE